MCIALAIYRFAMTIPTFQEIMLPLLRLAADGEVRVLATVRKQLAQHFRLTPAAGLDAAIEENLKYPDFREGTIWH
jgi:hypothetical protein